MFEHRTGYFFGSAAKLWWIFVFAGLFALASPYLTLSNVSQLRATIVGLVAIALGLVLKLNYYGLQIDMAKSRIRNYVAILGIRRGQWRPMPEIKKINLTSAKVSSWNTPNGISPTFKSNVTTYTIGLFSNEESPEYFIQMESAMMARVRAAQLSKLFGIAIDNLEGRQ